MKASQARLNAIANGHSTYVPESPCARGHSLRNISGTCIECRKIQEKNRYHADPEKTKARIKAKYQANAEKFRSNRRKLYAANPEKEREIAKLRSREWRKNNPNHRNALKSKYVADRSKRIPPWADKSELVSFYKACPKGFHVDHIYPLRGKYVSGFHVIGNLQYLPAIENMKKNNRYTPA
jgi:hypothetical protein